MIDERDQKKIYQENFQKFMLDSLRNNHKEMYDQLEEEFQNLEPVANTEKSHESKHNHENIENKKSEIQETEEKMKDILKNLIHENHKLNEDIKKLYEESNLIKVEFNHQVKSLKNTLETEKELIVRKIAHPLVSILSTIDLAKNSCQHDQNILIGIEMLEKQFLEVLNSFKIHKVQIKIGDQFDANTCECIEKHITEDSSKNNTIQHILSFPFKLNDKLLNPGKVSIFQTV